MKFCPDCENLLITKIADIDTTDNPNNLVSYFCNNCAYTEDLKIKNKETNKCVYYNKKGVVSSKIDENVIPFLVLDPTLPRINNLQCPNTECESVKESITNDVRYIQIDSDTMTYLYKCNHCQQTWKNK